MNSEGKTGFKSQRALGREHMAPFWPGRLALTPIVFLAPGACDVGQPCSVVPGGRALCGKEPEKGVRAVFSSSAVSVSKQVWVKHS